jgi:hypothetical protein
MNSKQLAGIMGPTIIALTTSETINAHIWATNIAANIYLNGALLFVAGLAIVRAHNYWGRNWPIVITIIGWFAILLGLFRMFAPQLQLQGAQNTTSITVFAMLVLATGIFLTVKGYSREK